MSKSFFPGRLLAVVAVCVILAACGSGNPPPPGSTPSPGTAAPSTAQLDLELADRLYDEGAVEEATAIYTNAISRGDDGQRQQALLALARIQYQQGDNGAAEATVRAFLDEETAPEVERQALLLQGALQFAQGDNDEAERSFKAYVKTGGAAALYAQLRLAEIAGRRGDFDQAIQSTNEALKESLPASVVSNARFSLAAYYEDSGDMTSALDTYELLGTDAATRVDRGEALWLAAQLAFDSGDTARGLSSLQSLLTAYPWHDRSLQSLDDARFAPNISLTSRALVLYSHRINADADTAYRAIVEGGNPALAADAHWRLGILAERLQNYEEALLQYDASIAAATANRDTVTLGQALWDKSLALELLGRSDEAVQTFASIAGLAPSSEYASEALFRAGLLRFKEGLPSTAASIWARERDLDSDEESQARAYFWSAKVARALGNEDTATEDLSAAAALPGFDYYTLRARAELASPAGSPPAGELRPEEPDWSRIEEWIETQFGAEDTSDRATFFASPGYGRAIELLRAGLRTDAEVEFEQLIEDAGGSAWLLYRLARAASDEDLHSIAARAASAFITAGSGAPPEALALAYPAVYPQIVSHQATGNGFSPYLLLALVRQESFYDPRAVSPADATGLTQVIPTTAADIAAELSDEDFRNSDLLRPNVSLRFGAHYLGAQIDLLDGEIPAALAAYNGGPGNAARWQEAAASSDPDVFLETIDFPETRAYVELVLENYAAYLYAYGLTDEPSLPLQ